MARYTPKSEVRLVFYSICEIVPVFLTGIRIKENECAFSLQRFQLKKVHFSRFLSLQSESKKKSVPFHSNASGWKKRIFHIVLYKIWKKLSP